jgi:hypothetical protein
MGLGYSHIVIGALVLAGASIGAPSIGVGHNCTCRANGVSYALGKLVCIRGKLSRCEMSQNVTSWKVVSNVCPVASNERQTQSVMAHPAATIQK